MLFLGIILDQLTKQWIVQTMPKYDVIPVIPGFFNLVHVYNRGAAFGLLATWSLGLVSYFFVIATLVVLAVVGYLFWRTPLQHRLFLWGYSLLISGAVGNLMDRIRLGEVIDFLDFYVGRYHWPAFNVADSLICLGAGLIFLGICRSEGEINVSHPV
ncbi:Lipoprotein signal peptidase [Desulfobacca acetoxidans DSM 11109]|uniref:Lipoprotein signal peptidase n=1 Tax=Desulfobacca acetoxidans (strain ATCC 700848 / DSM 11109 / ASRB2) TaxID=880072 RepID=F2NE79_DESAR|nr:Lipoprotein signal peptidase [Desulfobacca acetoxidans DSM 11109]